MVAKIIGGPYTKVREYGRAVLARSTFPFLFALVACGPTAKPEAHEATRPERTDDHWSKLGFEDRHAVMTFTVLPNMGRTWRDFRGTVYPEMTCRTCHGKDAEAVSYRMPNPALPPIDPKKPPPGRMTEFMKTKMVPDMLDLLGTTPEHLTCNTCHPKASAR